MAVALAAPPVVPWDTWYPGFRSRWAPGQHCFFDGPTGSGKTVACRVLARNRLYVVVLGTKPRDPEMDAYIADGFVRIEDWPPTPKQLKPQPDGSVHLILWPKIKTRQDLRRFRPVYARFLDDAQVKGGWTIVADEGHWLSSRSGLFLSDHLEAIAYGGRSADVTLMLLAQRPRGIPIHAWTNASHLFIWHGGNTDDQRELASLGTHPPREVQAAVQQLEGFDFLYLPARSGSDWAISRVPAELI